MNKFAVFLLILLSGLPPGRAGELRCGAARSCITPALGTLINGGVEPGSAKQIHDDLFVRALVLDDGATRLAVAVVDTCLVDRPVFDAAKKMIREHTGISPERVLLSATHTHSAGSVCGAHLTEADPAYRAWLPGRISDAVRCALNNLEPAEIGWGSSAVPKHVFCRRLLVKPGVTYTNQLQFTGERAKMNWDSPHPADAGPAGPTDPEFFVVSIRHPDGRPLALLANYSLHYVGDVGPGHISADYFGAFADRIQSLLNADRQDPPFVGILCNGTSGDVNNINPSPTAGLKTGQPPYSRIRAVADDLAQHALELAAKAKYQKTLKLSAAEAELRIQTRRPNPAEVEHARMIVTNRPLAELRSWTDNYAREQILLAEFPREVSVPIQVLRVGDLAVAAWPGEIFASSGLELKQRTPVKPLFNIGLANGWFGYIPPPEQFPLGAYETWRMRTSYLESNAIPKMVSTFLDLLSPKP